MGKEKIESVDAYLDRFPPATKEILERIRKIILEVAPESTEKISYQMPTYYLKGNMVHFAAYEKHVGFYPAPSGIAAFEKELKPYKHAKGSVQFPLDKAIPYDLIRRITVFRAKEQREK